MCIVFWKLLDNSPYRLILAFNRDEYFSRPTLGFHHWPTEPAIFAPQDLLPPAPQRGTYLGAHRRRVAFLTNFREPPPPNAKISRGALVRDYLLSKLSALDYAQMVYEQGGDYAGFNLVLFDLDTNQTVYVTNRGYKGQGTVKALEGGVMGLSNATIDDVWPKVEQGREAFVRALEASSGDEQSLIENIMLMMRDPSPFSTHVPTCLDDLKKCIFVPELSDIHGLPSGKYGTRSTDVILLSNDQITVAESDHTSGGCIRTTHLKI